MRNPVKAGVHLLAGCVSALLVTTLSAQQGGGLPPIDPASSGEAEGFGTSAAGLGGDSGLGNAISDGSLDIYYGKLPPGTDGVSVPGPNPYGPSDVIIISQGATPSGKVLAIWHEWFHLESDEPPTDPDDPGTTDEEKKEWACDEADAHCEVLKKMLYSANEGKPFHCYWKEKVIGDLEWTSFQCGWGYGAFGPPGPVGSGVCPCCPDVYSIPCES